MSSILIVCSANQCRSPIAAALLQRQLDTLSLNENWRVESAGTWAMDGKPADPTMQVVAIEWGIDLSKHRSRSVTAELLADFDLILTVERGQKEALQAEFPAHFGRIHLFTEMVGVRYDIPDPSGQTPEAYRRTVRELDRLIQHGAPRLREMMT